MFIFVEPRFIGGFTLPAPIDKSGFYEVTDFVRPCHERRCVVLDANTILTTTLCGDIPKNWHVYHARQSPLVLKGIVVGLLTLLLSAIIMGVNIVLGGPQLNVGLIVLVSVVVGLVTWLAQWRRAKDAVLIIMPDGFVQYTGSHTPFAVSYAELKNMDVQVRGRTNLGYTCSLVIRTRDEISAIQLKLSYPDGRVVVWSPAKLFGPSLDIAPYINEGYVQHFGLRKWGKARKVQKEQGVIIA